MNADIQTELRSQAHRLTHLGRPWSFWHTPLRLLAGLVSEVGELAHLMRFTPIEMIDQKSAADEIADIGILWFRLADSLGVDALEAVLHKTEHNERRFG